ncbi:hypothetical protein BHM03_00037462 [Ensete ventricosum]|nr:hypothetical protein BHM03_00037462 [Ensete ventricosum]
MCRHARYVLYRQLIDMLVRYEIADLAFNRFKEMTLQQSYIEREHFTAILDFVSGSSRNTVYINILHKATR